MASKRRDSGARSEPQASGVPGGKRRDSGARSEPKASEARRARARRRSCTQAVSARRVPRPLRADAEVLENRAEGGENLRLRLRVPGWPGFLPGQFVMLSPGARTSVERTRPAAAAADGDLPDPPGGRRAEVEILYRRVGRGTRLLAEALPGQALRVVGPLGRPFPAPAPGERALLVAGGTGIASVYQLAARLQRPGPRRGAARRAHRRRPHGRWATSPRSASRCGSPPRTGAAASAAW